MYSDPVIGDDFIGRQTIIDLLVKRAKGLKSGYRQNVAIIGHQQLGKTSLLRHFLHIYRDPAIVLVYVEIKFQAIDYFIDQFIRSLLFQFVGIDEAKPLYDEAITVIAARVVGIPKTIDQIHHIAELLKKRQFEEAYSKLFELTTIVKEESGKNCIVILDEFHRIGEFGVKNAFSDFGKRIMLQKDTMYLLSSSSFSASKKILAEKLSLLFGNFERVYLEPFDYDTAFDFLDKKIAPTTLELNLKYFLTGFTDGHPFYLNTIASSLREQSVLKREANLSRRTVAESFSKLLFESQGILNQYFMKLITPWTVAQSRGSHILILVAIAKGVNKLKDIAKQLNRPQVEISKQMQELIERELIIKNGVFYRFHNRIFSFWLREVYEKKELSPVGMSGQPDEFLKRMEILMAENDELLGMTSSLRVQHLFRMFNNDMVEFGEKGRRLPHFTELIELETAVDEAGATFGHLKGSSRDLIAKGHGRCWLCKILEEKATEKEVLQWVAENKAAQKNATRVLVTLRGMEDNAKLLAKEKKILTLSLSKINTLMDIYGHLPMVKVRADRLHPSQSPKG